MLEEGEKKGPGGRKRGCRGGGQHAPKGGECVYTRMIMHSGRRGGDRGKEGEREKNGGKRKGDGMRALITLKRSA